MAFVLFAVALVLLAAWTYVRLCDRSDEAVALNLSVTRAKCNCWGGCCCGAFKGLRMAKLNDSFLARIAPTNDDAPPGAAPVTDIMWSTSDAYSVTAMPDGVTATITAIAASVVPGAEMVTVSAMSKGGVVLSDSKPLPDVDVAVDEEAVALNLTIEPI